RAVFVECRPLLERRYVRQLGEYEAGRQQLIAPARLLCPLTREPADKTPLFEDAGARAFDRLALAVGRFVTVPLVPMTGDALQWTAQQSPRAKTLGAPMPESPEPNEGHNPVGRLVLFGEWCRPENEPEGHGVRHLECLPRRGQVARQLDVQTVLILAGEICRRRQ